ncbi:MAG TPA: thiopurine S-methyltransferase [Polyangiaceae bacterium]|nr:thiopurine S-methyltransferase [Polyangiaceae bacterium]
MKPDYWLERWQAGHIGFHRATENPALVHHHERALGECVRVLVPLCGKSADLEWLVVAGHEVLGIELSELAAQAFFSERGFTPERREQGPFVAYQHGSVTILTGDFFAASEADVGLFDGVYDRAALIALPEELRARYAQHLPTLLTPKAKMLLLTLHFDAEGGPPFSVSPDEVQQLYTQPRITLLGSTDARSDAPGPVERGATFVSENVHLLEFP